MTTESFVEKKRLGFGRIKAIFPRKRKREKRSESTQYFLVGFESLFDAGNEIFEETGGDDYFEDGVDEKANHVDRAAGGNATIAVEIARAALRQASIGKLRREVL